MAKWISREVGVSLEDTEHEVLDYIKEEAIHHEKGEDYRYDENAQKHLTPLREYDWEDVHDINDYNSSESEILLNKSGLVDNRPHLDDYLKDRKLEIGKSTTRSGVSAEAYGNFNKKENWTPKVILKSESTKRVILKRLSNSFLFKTLGEDDQNIIVNAMEEMRFR